MPDFPRHTQDLARAIRVGDREAAEMALDMMARDGERPTSEIIDRGRALAAREMGALNPLPQLAEPDFQRAA